MNSPGKRSVISISNSINFQAQKTIAHNRKRLHAIVNKNRQAELYRNRVGIFK